MNKSISFKLPFLAAALAISATASAVPAPPAGTPYYTDPYNEYVQDATSDAIGNVNMILCIMNGMNPSGSGMVNGGAYVALVDMTKCDTKGKSSDSSSSSSGASVAANFMNAVVNVTRQSDADPMIAKVWMSMTDQGRKQKIFVRVTATSSPADVPPYGVFRLDFIGKDAATLTTQFNGYIESTGANMTYYETGQNSSNVALKMAVSSTTAGSGTMTAPDQSTQPPVTKTYDFAYDSSHFRRGDGTNDRCFDRTKANATKSVWQYGTYDLATGLRVDQTNPSFPVTATYGGNSYYGYAGYWGINFQGLDLADGQPVSGVVVHDQRPPHATDTYSLSKVGGKLTKWSQNAATLADMVGIPFYFGADMTTGGNKTNSGTIPSGWQNWQAHWDGTQFVLTGTQICGQSGCSLTSLATPALVTPSALHNMPVSGWSDSFGGNINIPPKATDYAGIDPVYYYTQTVIIPGSAGAPTALYCLSNCPDHTSVGLANNYASGATPSPFNTSTVNQWFSAPTANTVTYAYGSSGLTEASTPMIVTNAAFYAATPNFQYGVQTGRLFDTAFSSCGTGMVCEPANPGTYYTWSTGTDQWNQTMWLTHTNGSSSGQDVTFDPPQNIQFTVSSANSTADSSWLGKTIQLQFNGFGNVNGIPGSCVNPVDNTVANCGPNTRYVPAFSLKDGALMTLGSTTLIVKALNAELRLADVGAGASCPNLSTLTPQTVPSGGTHDMTSSSDAYYIGTKPTPANTAPKVIDGVVQY